MNIDMDKDMEYDLCVLGELNYKNSHQDLDDTVLFPSEWDLNSNYGLKNEILEEAIMNNILISQTEKFQKMLNDDLDSMKL